MSIKTLPTPVVSIITVCKNDARRLLTTLESVKNQNFQNFEHIIIDGASTDNTIDIIKANTHKNLQFYTGKDSGLYDAMNKGSYIANGKYLLFLNAGDHFLNKKSLEVIHLEEIVKNTISPDLIVSRSLFKFKDNNEALWTNHKKNFFFRLAIYPHNATFIKKTFFIKNGGYNLNYKIASDQEFFHRAIIKDKAFVQDIDSVLSVFYMDGLSNTFKGSLLRYLEEFIITFKFYSFTKALQNLFFNLFYRILNTLSFGLVKKINNFFKVK